MKISVIIPVYNGEKYLKKTIDLLLNQPYEDVEIILINDGSTDGSQEICEYYSHKFEKIILINKENEGISAARNTGIAHATGEWISFVDQDDEISPYIYLAFTNNINQKEDFIIAGKEMMVIGDSDQIIDDIKYTYPPCFLFEKEKIFEIMFNTNRDSAGLHLWNCLFKKSIIKQYSIMFETKLKYGHEDSLFNIEYMSNCSSIKMIPDIVYQYYRRSRSSTSLKINDLYIDDYKLFICRAKDAYQNLKINKEELFYVYCYRLGISLYAQYGINKSIEEKKNDLSEITKFVEKKFDHRVKVSIKDLYSLIIWIIIFFLKRQRFRIADLLISIIK